MTLEKTWHFGIHYLENLEKNLNLKKYSSYRQSFVSIEKSNPYKKSGPKTTFICKEGNTEKKGCDANICMYVKGGARMQRLCKRVNSTFVPVALMCFEYGLVLVKPDHHIGTFFGIPDMI